MPKRPTRISYEVRDLGPSLTGDPQRIEVAWAQGIRQASLDFYGHGLRFQPTSTLINTSPRQLSDLIDFLSSIRDRMVEQDSA